MGIAAQMQNGTADYDALYIGDLQWVRLSCRLVHMCCLSFRLVLEESCISYQRLFFVYFAVDDR